MAASFGEKLLLEVHEESLDEMLHDLRALHPENPESTRARIGVAPFDQLLDVFRTTLQSLHNAPVDEERHSDQQDDPPSAEIESEPAHYELHAQMAFTSRPYPVLEISSTSSAAGKSQTLYYLVATAVLPAELNGFSLGGLNSAAVFIDNDGRFDAERLRTIARGIVHDRLPTDVKAQHDSIESMLLASLQHVHIFKPLSSSALLATLQSLDTYLLDLQRHVSTHRPLQAIFIDSATAFFWQDKLQDEIARTEEIGRFAAEIERERREKRSFHLADLYADLVASLKRLQHIFDCAVIYTTTSFSGKTTQGSALPYGSYNPLDFAIKGSAFRSPLPPPWGLFPTLRLVLQREVVRSFPPGVTVQEAQRDAPMRQEVVMRGEFLASVNGWGREDWPRRVLEELARRGGGQYAFNISSRCVRFS